MSGPGRLNRPWRAARAVVELVVAAALVWLAFTLWPHGMATITDRAQDGVVLVSTKYFGNWLAGAIGVGAVAALLVLDVVRQLVLAIRATPRDHDAEPRQPVAEEPVTA